MTREERHPRGLPPRPHCHTVPQSADEFGSDEASAGSAPAASLREPCRSWSTRAACEASAGSAPAASLHRQRRHERTERAGGIRGVCPRGLIAGRGREAAPSAFEGRHPRGLPPRPHCHVFGLAAFAYDDRGIRGVCPRGLIARVARSTSQTPSSRGIRGVCPRGLIASQLFANVYLDRFEASAGSAPAASLRGRIQDVAHVGDMRHPRGLPPRPHCGRVRSGRCGASCMREASAGSAPAASLQGVLPGSALRMVARHPRGLPPRPHCHRRLWCRGTGTSEASAGSAPAASLRNFSVAHELGHYEASAGSAPAASLGRDHRRRDDQAAEASAGSAPAASLRRR